MGKLSKIIISGRKVEPSDLRGLNTRDILDDAKIILEQSEIPDEVLSVLSFHEDTEIRLALAKRGSNSEEVLRRLATDDDAKVGRSARKQLRKKRTLTETLQQIGSFLFSATKKLIVLALVVGASIYVVSLLRPAMKRTQNAVKAVQNITPEQKAYMACTLTLKAADPQTKDFSSCAPYLTADDIKKKKVQTAEFDGECPAGYKFARNLQTPICVSEKSSK